MATVVEVLDALWDFSAEPRVFGSLVERVCRFEELVIAEAPDYVAETLQEGSVMFTLAAFKEALSIGTRVIWVQALCAWWFAMALHGMSIGGSPARGSMQMKARRVDVPCRHMTSRLSQWNAPGWQRDMSATNGCNLSWRVLPSGRPGDRISSLVETRSDGGGLIWSP
ncbi:hypothetical protein FB566_5010 [Stackebrandtia endophytica]|uniref:Uncharacterized protein n=1 Tax=Stackebrandtia endophytica TaxID=1496996 RepID=A0A543B3I6_9ACTN|nr:hypothetical protein FB566_5010 [Stackebrandtia endophytica]